MAGAAVINSTIAAAASGSLTISATNNAILLIVFRTGSSTQFINSIAGPAASWTPVRGAFGNVSQQVQPGAFYMSAYLGYANATGSQTITPTFNTGAPSTVYLFMAECSGIAASGAILSSIGAQQTNVAAGANAGTVAGGTGSDTISTVPAFVLTAGQTTSGALSSGTGFTQNVAAAARLLESAQVVSAGTFDSTSALVGGGGTATVSSFQVALLQSNQTSYAFVQDSAACSSVAVATLSTPAVTVTAGNFLFAACWGNGQSVTTVTDGPGDTFTSQGNTGAGKLQVYACANAAGGSTAVQFNVGGATNIQVYMAEYSGLAQSIGSILGTANTTSHVGTAVTGGAINFTSVPALLWSMLMDTSSDATAPICTGIMTTRATALWACNSPNDLNCVGDSLISVSGNASPTFLIGNQFDTLHCFSVAVPLFSSAPASPPLAQLMNRRTQLYFV